MQLANGNMLSRQYGWMLAIRGIIAILFGIAAVVWTGMTLVILIYLFGAYALVDGIFAVIVALQERKVATRWWVLLIEGIVGIIIGLGVLLSPVFALLAALFFLYLIAAWAIITGIFEIAAAFSMHRSMAQEWTLALAGLLSIIFGALLAILNVRGLLSLVWLLGIYAIVFGIMLLIRAFQFRTRHVAVTV